MTDQAAKSASKTSPAPSGRPPAWIGTVWGVALVVFAYRALFSLVLAASSPRLSMDNVADNVWAQSLSLAYQRRQPPLFEWLLWPVQQLTGPNAASFLIVKTGLVTLTAAFLFGAARYAIRDRRLAAVAVLSYGLFYNIGWTFLDRLTQTSLLLCCCAAAAWAMARALRTGRLADYALLGLAFGAGLLSKFNFGLFAASLIAAAAIEPKLRGRLRWAGVGLAAAIAGLAFAPYAYAVTNAGKPLAPYLSRVMRGDTALPYAERLGEGLGLLALGLIEFSLILVPLALIVFRRPLLAGALPRDDGPAAYARLFGLTSLLAALAATLGVVASGSTYIRDWHMAPVFATLPIWMFARIERGGYSAARMRLWVWIVTVLVLGCAAVRAGAAFAPQRLYCPRCTPSQAYVGLAGQIESQGLGGGTLYVIDPYAAGNLRAQLPRARILVPGLEFPPARLAGRSCAAVWRAGDDADRNPVWGVRPLDPNAAVCR